MYREQDPVDSALESLRSATWTGSSFNPKLEEQLMEEFKNQQTFRRVRKGPMWAISAAVLLVGGATFAATGGVALLKNWLVKVQIGDRVYEFNTDQAGQGTITVQTDDGREAQINVQKVENTDGNGETQVSVHVAASDSEKQQEVRLVRRNGAEPASTYTTADLKDTQPVTTFTDSSGATRALHLVPAEDSSALGVFMAITGTDGATTVRKLTDLPSQLNLAGQTPTATTDENGMVTLRFDDGRGEVRVLKFKLVSSTSDQGLPPDSPVQINADKGQIQIKVENPPDGD